jgi:hypothetical protein
MKRSATATNREFGLQTLEKEVSSVDANKNAASEFRSELESFQNLWKGGYSEGNPLDPMGISGYGALGYMSVLHVVYLTCIKPYVTNRSTVLEIGSGRGCWTKTLLHANEVWCLDALSAEHNGFWSYLGHPTNVKYFQVSDFSCSMLPEDKFSYLFSFGCFCHISFEATTEYMKNLYPKLKAGAHCFVMIADYDKRNTALDNIGNLSIGHIFSQVRHYMPLRLVWKLIDGDKALKRQHGNRADKDEDDVPRPGRWYHAGIGRTCEMLEKLGYNIVDPDVGATHRDPIVHFTKG